MLRQHIIDLAARNRIALTIGSVRGRAMRAAPSRGTSASIRVPEIKSQITYLIALHELGHLLSRGNRSKLQLEREADAWRWALDHSLVEPTPATCKRIRTYLATYHQRALLRGMLGRRVVAKIPDGDSIYWEVMGELGDRAGLSTVVNDRERQARLRHRAESAESAAS
jgi:hypothetical protein